MTTFDNENFRFGSAGFATTREIADAGMFKETPDALLIGFDGNKQIWYSGAGGLLMVAGARGGKLATILGYNLCHGIAGGINFVTLDMKGELAAISRDQTPDKKYCIYWNAQALHDLPQHRINPVDYMRADSPSLVSDIKVYCENMIVTSGGTNSAYFEGRAREFLEGIIVTLVKRDGVLTLPALYEAINLIPTDGDAWLDLAWEMNQSGYPLSVRVEEEIATARGQDGSGGGFQGILGELFRAFACLSDPALMASVSPPYHFSFADLCEDDRRWQVYLCPPAEFVSAWSPVIKSMFVAGMIYKSRKPSAPSQTWVLDECAQLSKFPLVTKLFTYGAGIGVRPWAIYQSSDQMKQTGINAETIIPSSAAVRSYFTVRDLPSAQLVSRMLGAETLEYDDELQQSRARMAKRQAVQAMIMGGDPFSAAMQASHHSQASQHRSTMQRWLRTPDEVLNMPVDKQFIFADALPGAIYADRKPYYEQAFMAGRFHPNPYHQSEDHPDRATVRVKTRFGYKWLPIIAGPVPRAFANYPQYMSGFWSRVRS